MPNDITPDSALQACLGILEELRGQQPDCTSIANRLQTRLEIIGKLIAELPKPASVGPYSQCESPGEAAVQALAQNNGELRFAELLRTITTGGYTFPRGQRTESHRLKMALKTLAQNGTIAITSGTLKGPESNPLVHLAKHRGSIRQRNSA